MPLQAWGAFRFNDDLVGQIVPGLVWVVLLGVQGGVGLLSLGLLGSMIGLLSSAWCALFWSCWLGLVGMLIVLRALHDGTRGQEGERWPHCGRKRLY